MDILQIKNTVKLILFMYFFYYYYSSY